MVSLRITSDYGTHPPRIPTILWYCHNRRAIHARQNTAIPANFRGRWHVPEITICSGWSISSRRIIIMAGNRQRLPPRGSYRCDLINLGAHPCEGCAPRWTTRMKRLSLTARVYVCSHLRTTITFALRLAGSSRLETDKPGCFCPGLVPTYTVNPVTSPASRSPGSRSCRMWPGE
jgi:hypothetical protein